MRSFDPPHETRVSLRLEGQKLVLGSESDILSEKCGSSIGRLVQINYRISEEEGFPEATYFDLVFELDPGNCKVRDKFVHVVRRKHLVTGYHITVERVQRRSRGYGLKAMWELSH